MYLLGVSGHRQSVVSVTLPLTLRTASTKGVAALMMGTATSTAADAGVGFRLLIIINAARWCSHVGECIFTELGKR